VELILELLCEIIVGVVNVLSEKDIVYSIYEVCMTVIKVYVKNNANRVAIDSDDECPQDLILLLKLMSYLLSKTFIEETGNLTKKKNAEDKF
jgi:hypothetical protein